MSPETIQPDNKPESQEPVAAPEGTAPAAETSGPGLIVLQWLTYAFWGWTVLALSVLTSLVISNFLRGSDGGGAVPYGIAAILVLLPISYIVDSFYSKREPAKKSGAAVWVMVVHAVLFALFAIGSLITAVIALVSMLTSGGDSKGQQVVLYSALIIALYYGLTFLRTLNPEVTRWLQRSYKLVMLITVGVIAVLGIIGPAAAERATRNDRLISENLSEVVEAVNGYSRANDKLPADLQALELRGDAAKLIEQKLIEYKPEGAAPQADKPTGANSPAKTVPGAEICLMDATRSVGPKAECVGNPIAPPEPSFRYQLCATFARESRDYNEYQAKNYDRYEDDGYQTHVSAYEHPAGKQCYKLRTGDYL